MAFMISNHTTLQTAAEHLSGVDLVLAPVISLAGTCTIAPHTNYYQDLVETIIGQQLSVKAAATIRGRFMALFDSDLPAPELILEKSIEELRAVGLSGAKAVYIRDLAQHVVDGKVKFDHLDGLSNEEIIRELTAVKGIGEWSVHMFLMFCMGRMDILAYGDLGIRSGVKKLYQLDHLPSPKEVIAIADANNWHPYESIACWYVWRALDNKPM
jgi:DNA-3-methyladenine glycosylase II